MIGVFLNNNFFKCKGIKFSNQKTEMKKCINTHNPTLCYLQETHFGSKDTNKLKVKEWCLSLDYYFKNTINCMAY